MDRDAERLDFFAAGAMDRGAGGSPARIELSVQASRPHHGSIARSVAMCVPAWTLPYLSNNTAQRIMTAISPRAMNKKITPRSEDRPQSWHRPFGPAWSPQ